VGRVPGLDAAAVDRCVERALRGDQAALEALLGAVRDDVYNLAVRMLWHPADAEDATQEVLVKVATHLSGFRREASFRTWVLRIASNHLLTTRRRRAERERLTFPLFGAQLAEGLDEPVAAGADVDEGLLVEEVKIGCTQAMLLCLDRDHRLAYLLGSVFGLGGEEAAYVLGVEPAAYRKRLQRARDRIRSFMAGHCGLVDPANPCRCRRRLGRAVAAGRVDPGNLLFATHPRRDGPLGRPIAEMEALHRAAEELHRAPAYAAPERLAEHLRRVLRAGRLAVLEGGSDVHRSDDRGPP
jgi:RNA polymerase sigma factor (sigma-70 family)